MRQTFIFLVIFLSTIACNGQVDEENIIISDNKPTTDNTYEIEALCGITCEIMPEYMGGWEKCLEFIKANLNRDSIPDSTGKVLVRFIVNKNGGIENPVILKGLSKSTNEECLRVVRLLKFTPGLQNKKPISVPFCLPINVDPNFNPCKKSKKISK